MSLTSYRTAPPRADRRAGIEKGRWSEHFQRSPCRMCGMSIGIIKKRVSRVTVRQANDAQSCAERVTPCTHGLSRLRLLRSRPVLSRPGSDRLSQALRLSTIGAEGFNGRVRNGIGFGPLARATRPTKHRAGRSPAERMRRIVGSEWRIEVMLLYSLFADH